MRRELKIFLYGFGLPFVALIVFDLVSVPSSLPWWRRLLTFEDLCVYGMCVILPVIVYVCARLFIGPARHAPTRWGRSGQEGDKHH